MGITITYPPAEGGGGGDNVFVNDVAVVDINLDDAAPAAPAGDLNIKWQTDGATPPNAAAYVDVSVIEPLLSLQNLGGAVVDGQIPAAIARDSEVTTAITNHEAASDPHPQYALEADLPYSFKFMTSHQFTNNVSMDVVSGLSFALASGISYHFKYGIVWTSGVLGVGFRTSVSCPSVSRLVATAEIANTITDGGGAVTHGVINSSGDDVVSANSPGANTLSYAQIEGVLIPSATTTLDLLGGIEASSSGATIYPGSFGMLWRLG